MLKVEIGYVDFNFPEDDAMIAFGFAKNAREHLDPKENKRITICFVDEEEEES